MINTKNVRAVRIGTNEYAVVAAAGHDRLLISASNRAELPAYVQPMEFRSMHTGHSDYKLISIRANGLVLLRS